MLARRDHSLNELKLKLQAKGYPLEQIRTVITHLSQSDLINESRFVENYIRWRRNKGFGPERIMLELQARGISSDMIAEQLDIADNAWFTEASKLWQKRFKGKRPEDFKSKAKQMRFLQYRGFSREQIEQIFDEDL